MKKIFVLASLIALFSVGACSNEKKEEVKKETVITPAPQKEAPEKKNTSISVDKNGVKVETKKIDVTVNPERKKD